MAGYDAETVNFISENCECFADGEGVKTFLLNVLNEDEGMLEEVNYYMKNGDFLCKESVSGYTVIDIMIWQMDHFKAYLDRDMTGMKSNRSEMVMKAFATFALMKREPNKYLRLLTEETGSDFEGKIS